MVHIMFKMSSIDICICSYSTLFTVVTRTHKLVSSNNSDRWDNPLHLHANTLTVMPHFLLLPIYLPNFTTTHTHYYNSAKPNQFALITRHKVATWTAMDHMEPYCGSHRDRVGSGTHRYQRFGRASSGGSRLQVLP